jgi:hypothetical protein
MSRLNCGVPIYALTAQTYTRYRCTLFRDTYPLMVKYVGNDREELLAEAEAVLVRHGVVKDGDLIVLTIGEPIGKSGRHEHDEDREGGRGAAWLSRRPSSAFARAPGSTSSSFRTERARRARFPRASRRSTRRAWR